MDCEIMTWAEGGSPTDWATQAPLILIYFLGGGDRESEAGSALTAKSPIAGLKLMNAETMTWGKVQHLIEEATQAPQEEFFKLIVHTYIWM